MAANMVEVVYPVMPDGFEHFSEPVTVEPRLTLRERLNEEACRAAARAMAAKMCKKCGRKHAGKC